jgi:hypothetical protein
VVALFVVSIVVCGVSLAAAGSPGLGRFIFEQRRRSRFGSTSDGVAYVAFNRWTFGAIAIIAAIGAVPSLVRLVSA